jgi:hypothetical protein
MTDLGASFQDEYVRDWVLLTMYYDLMSLFAQSYAHSISVGLTLLQARTTVVAQLVNLLALADLAPYHEIPPVIAKQVIPAPPPPTQQQRAQRSRFSCAIMSAPPDGYLPPSSSDTEEEDEDSVNEAEDDESSAQSVLDYEEDAYSTNSTPQHKIIRICRTR